MATPIISRAQAKAEGLARYFTGLPCKHGHLSERHVSTKHCLECDRQTSKRRYDADPEAWLLRNFHWRGRNAEKWAATRARWQRLNPEKTCAIAANYKARRLGAEGMFTEDDILDLYKTQDRRCACCGEDLAGDYEIDHVVPLSLYGSNWPSNLQLLCRSCNGAKGSKHPGDFCRDYKARHGVWPLFAESWGFAT